MTNALNGARGPNHAKQHNSQKVASTQERVQRTDEQTPLRCGLLVLRGACGARSKSAEIAKTLEPARQASGRASMSEPNPASGYGSYASVSFKGIQASPRRAQSRARRRARQRHCPATRCVCRRPESFPRRSRRPRRRAARGGGPASRSHHRHCRPWGEGGRGT